MKYLKSISSILLITIGLVMWINRPTYIFPTLPNHGSSYTASKSAFTIGDLTTICSHPEKFGYLLITGRIDMQTITGDRQAFFQTNNTDSRLFLEYDPGQQSILQFGIQNPDESVQLIALGKLKRVGSFLFSIMIESDGSVDTWVAGAATSESQTVPLQVRATNPNINCEKVRLNAANGMEGTDGTVKISISGGTDVKDGEQKALELQEAYEKSLPNNNYQYPLYLGVLVLFTRFRIRLKRHPLVE
jgi:hypothetical protein